MCGIAGYCGPAALAGRARSRATLELMRGAGRTPAAHWRATPRGGRHVHLLHARLAIIDLDARANQPFAIGGRDARLQRRALQLRRAARASWSARARASRTTSDTEVLLQVLPRCTARTRSTAARACGRFADLRRATGGRCCCRATASARSRSTCCRDGDGALLRLRGQVPRARWRGRRLPVNVEHLTPLSRQRLQGALQDAATPSSTGVESCARRDA